MTAWVNRFLTASVKGCRKVFHYLVYAVSQSQITLRFDICVGVRSDTLSPNIRAKKHKCQYFRAFPSACLQFVAFVCITMWVCMFWWCSKRCVTRFVCWRALRHRTYAKKMYRNGLGLFPCPLFATLLTDPHESFIVNYWLRSFWNEDSISYIHIQKKFLNWRQYFLQNDFSYVILYRLRGGFKVCGTMGSQ